jgi:hypothetical protein
MSAMAGMAAYQPVYVNLQPMLACVVLVRVGEAVCDQEMRVTTPDTTARAVSTSLPAGQTGVLTG